MPPDRQTAAAAPLRAAPAISEGECIRAGTIKAPNAGWCGGSQRSSLYCSLEKNCPSKTRSCPITIHHDLSLNELSIDFLGFFLCLFLLFLCLYLFIFMRDFCRSTAFFFIQLCVCFFLLKSTFLGAILGFDVDGWGIPVPHNPYY